MTLPSNPPFQTRFTVELRVVRTIGMHHSPYLCLVAKGVDTALVDTVRGTPGTVNDVVENNSLLHGRQSVVFADVDYQGAAQRPDATASVN